MFRYKAINNGAMSTEQPLQKMDTRSRILAIALKHFARNGYAGTRLDDIANDVGIRRPSLFHHFKDKATLYKAVWKYTIDEQDAKLAPYFDQADTSPTELLNLATDAWVEYAFSNPDFIYLSLHAAVSGRASDHPQLASTLTLERWQQLIERGVNEGVFNTVPFVECMSLLAGMTSFYLTTPNNALPQLTDSYSGDRVLFANRLKLLMSNLLIKPQAENILPFRR
ncbi:TetR/AcrR family transcriptional regulator [Litorivivens sp.]|uniref:TetR/AcrR family transcriptional regulator n=1 Tax=Litorivivens sp. TaxID=2020868 RepID=UPI0035645066